MFRPHKKAKKLPPPVGHDEAVDATDAVDLSERFAAHFSWFKSLTKRNWHDGWEDQGEFVMYTWGPELARVLYSVRVLLTDATPISLSHALAVLHSTTTHLHQMFAVNSRTSISEDLGCYEMEPDLKPESGDFAGLELLLWQSWASGLRLCQTLLPPDKA